MTDEALVRTLVTGESASPLLPWRRYAFPLDWGAHFSARPGAPLHLEVGFGDGRYTVRRALENPKQNFVGLEVSSASVQRALHKVKRAELDNVKLLKVGAQFAVRQLFGPGSLSSITVNFPDPWPKERHEKNRLLQRSFFELAASRLVSGGAIRLATDHPDYLAFARDQAELSGLFRLEDADPPDAVFETKYALKWKTQGKPLYYQLFRYEGGETPAFPVLTRVDVMPHTILQGELPTQVAFVKQVVPYASGHVILHEVAQSLGNDAAPDTDDTDNTNETDTADAERWLIRATIDEPDLRQQLLVVVQRRRGGELIVRLEPFGDPIITKAVRGAIHAVTEWLLSLPTDLEVVRRSY
ncbi:MAG: tRNA (guanosine(46)-N7)-methyltransferase TrmB [Trueperaceae bacterium]|nr:tRNA (guanosine(46)-N7)-methyltransferase TrmB [Trueperaceae bacterium]